MNIFSAIKNALVKPFALFKRAPIVIKLLTIILIIGAGYLVKVKFLTTKKASTSYTTSVLEKGTLISSISASGTITSGNSTDITTAASGTISKVYVKNGDSVIKGQKLAEITLDTDALEKRSSAWTTYIKATETIKSSDADKDTSDLEMWQAQQNYLVALDTQTSKNDNSINPKTNVAYTDYEKTIIDKTVTQTYKLFKLAELKYSDADTTISNSKVKVTAALSDYQKYSPTITAPASGIVNNLLLAPGIVIASPTSTTTTSTTSDTVTIATQTIGTVTNSDGQFQATANLTELDITKIKADQKVTLTLDAFPDMTFTGKVLAVNTAGSASSGVTSYPVTILLDKTTSNIYTKMAVTAQIITLVKDDVILVPTTAITTKNGQSTVLVMKNKVPTAVTVTLGESNDSQTEITEGLKEGDEVVTSSITASNSASNDNTSTPFGGTSTKSTNTKSSGSGTNILNGGMQMGGPPGGM